METIFKRLKDRASNFGNHNYKYIRMIELHVNQLIDRAESCGKIDQVHLWTQARNLSSEMEVILELGDTEESKLEFLGTYFALQFLHLNLRAIDVLILDLTTADDRLAVYKNFMLDVGAELRSLVATYMQKLFDLFLPVEQRPEFVICGVGTRTDQDDLDIGIIDDGTQNRDNLNRAVSKLCGEMLKRAVCLHMHISEHVGGRGYSASIAEYRELLDREIHDFVIISEMLNAARIFGSQRLFTDFQREITDRYYYHRGGENKCHEGYLRGILGEVRSLQIRQMKSNYLNLKNDALRMIKGSIFAGKTIFRIDKVNCWQILEELRRKDNSREELYLEMEKSLTFLEIFRYLYQLFMVQEDEIYFESGGTKESLSVVAKTMGYNDVGVTKAEEHLLIHYYEYVERAKRVIDKLLPAVTEHLKSVTVFSKLQRRALARETEGEVDGNIAIEFVEQSTFFRGTKFWDDVISSLENHESKFLIELVRDLCKLKPTETKKLIKRYVDWGKNSFIAVMSLIVQLARNRDRIVNECIYEEFNQQFLDTLTGSPDEIRRLTTVFLHYPELVNAYLFYSPESEQRKFAERLKGEVWEQDIARSQGRLLYLCQLHIDSSRYFKRFLKRVVDNHPEYIQLLDDLQMLQQISKGLYGDVDRYRSFGEKKEKLGDYFDIEFLRVGLMCLLGAPIQFINSQFTEFSTTYLLTLFDICKAEVDDELGEKVATKDLFAVFVAGGHAREQAFVDDYDILFLLDSSDEDIRAYGNKIASRMNSQIIRRAILPHYRFADLFGHYVTSLDELDDYFSSQENALVVDKSQVLGSRMVVGSHKFQQTLIERIIKPHVFDKRDEYIGQMIAEITSRQKEIRKLSTTGRNIKEGIGGLRDIEMTLLICKAHYRLAQPITLELINELKQVAPHYKKDFEALRDGVDFFEKLRDIYRLTASAEDELRPEYLGRAAEIMGFEDDAQSTATEKLMTTYRNFTARTTRVIRKILRGVVADSQQSSLVRAL